MNNKKALNEEIYRLTYDRVYHIYGSNPPESILGRLDEELNYIMDKGNSAMFLTARDLVKYSRHNHYPTVTRGGISASLVAYLLGITQNNPLPPHYLCPKCKNVEFIQNNRCGTDLEDKACPNCGASYLKFGFDIPMEEYFGLNSSEYPEIELIFAEEHQKAAVEELKKLCGSENVIKEDDRPGKYKVLLPTNEFNIGCLGRSEPSILMKMEKSTGISNSEISFNDPHAMNLFCSDSKNAVTDSKLPAFTPRNFQNILSIVQPKDFETLIHVIGMSYGSGCWEENGKNILSKDLAEFDSLVSSYADILRYLSQKGFSSESAYQVMKKALSKDINQLSDWTDFEWRLFSSHSIPDWYIEHISKIRFLITRAQCVEYAVLMYRVAWYKANYPTEFNHSNN